MNPVKLPDEYVVEAVLSPGPVAIVVRARRRDGTACVVKAAAMERARPMITREAAVLGALSGVPGVPRLLSTWADGFAIEIIALPTLRAGGEGLRADGGLRDRAARSAFACLADVHAARDERGGRLEVVHGDVSPENVYVAADGSRAVLADFGLARGRGLPPPDADAFRGTLLYAAPEVARGEASDARADDFALAASLLHVATGIPLRDGGDAGDAQAALLFEAGSRRLEASHPWRALAPKLFNFTVADALLGCLAFDPRDRPRDTPRPC